MLKYPTPNAMKKMKATDTAKLRLRQSYAILKALAQGSFLKVFCCAASIALICVLFILNDSNVDYGILGLGFILTLTLGTCGILMLLLLAHSSMDELHLNFPNYELMFPVPVWLSVTLHLAYKLVMWNLAISLLNWLTDGFSDMAYLDYVASLWWIASLLFLVFQQVVWLQNNGFRVAWFSFHLLLLASWYTWLNFELMLFHLGLLVFLCYAQVYLQRRGGFAFHFWGFMPDIRTRERKARTLSPLRSVIEVQWKAWYRWMFLFGTVVGASSLWMIDFGMSILFAANSVTMLFVILGYYGERRDANALFCTLRPLQDRVLVQARHLNALRCAVQTFAVFLLLDVAMNWLAYALGQKKSLFLYTDELSLLTLLKLLKDEDGITSIMLVYAPQLVLNVLIIWFALVAGRLVITLLIFICCASLILYYPLLPVMLPLKFIYTEASAQIAILITQIVITVLSLFKHDLVVLRHVIKHDGLARAISAAIVGGLAFLVFHWYENHSMLAFCGGAVMVAMIAAAHFGVLDKRTYFWLVVVGLLSIIAPLPVLLHSSKDFFIDWELWSATLFAGLALPLLCVPITVRYQRVLG